VVTSDLLAGSKTVTGVAMARVARTPRYAEHHRELWEPALDGRLRPIVHAEFPLAEAAAAHAVIDARSNLGKVVSRP
jgi:NADPH:quinone reductase-like Zn-dependent oxidoreductase